MYPIICFMKAYNFIFLFFYSNTIMNNYENPSKVKSRGKS